MKYKIIGDSSLDVNQELEDWLQPSYAPFTIMVEDKNFLDDEHLIVSDLLKEIASSREVSKTAAPSPHDYLRQMKGDYEGVFIITLSSKLSGSYNSAMVAKDLAKEEYPNLKVHVVDSLAASAGQTTLAIQIQECIEKGMNFEEIVSHVERFRDNDQLYFLLDNIDTLVKNGRMSVIKGIVAQLLHIKPILGDNGEGEIGLYDKARTYSKALDKLAALLSGTKYDAENRTLVIAHCCAQQRAELLRAKVAAQRLFKNIVIVSMKGLSSTYANAGGLVCAL